MAHYPQSATGLQYVTYPAGPTAAAATVASAGANAKGTYVEFVASLGFTANYITIAITRGVAAIRAYLLDVATGAAAAETVVVPNLIYANNNSSTSHNGATMRLPLEVASGTRVSAAQQCSSATQNMFVALTLMATGDTPAPTSYVNYGSNTADSMGVSVDPGASINTKGTYSALTASSSAVAQVLAVMVNMGTNSVPAPAQWSMDFATGAAASEVVLIPDLRTGSPTGSDAAKITIPWYEFLTYIAASTRLAVNASCDINDATDRILRVAVVAATAPAEPSGGGQRSYVG